MKDIGLCLLMVAVQAPVIAFAQVRDSVLYPEVKVEAGRIAAAIGSSVSESDTMVYRLLKDQGLTRVLQAEGFVSTRSYSPGGIANYAIRGTGSQHTQVVWDGIPINDPMLGQTDLSTVVMTGISGIRVLYGSAGLTNHSGGIGGTIELIPSKAKVEDGLDGNLNMYVGSFGSYGTTLQLRDRYRMFFGSTSIAYHTAQNNFPYTHLATLVDRDRVMEHAMVEQIGVSRSIGAQIDTKNTIEARINYSQVGRQLPATMLMASTKEELLDRDIWTSLKWIRLGQRSKIKVTASYIYGKQEYQDNNDHTFHHLYQASKNLVRYDLYLPNHLKLELGGDVFAEHARSDSAYRHNDHWRQWQAAFASLRYLPKKWVSAQILLREDVIDGRFSPIQGLVGVEVRPLKGFFLKGNVSRNFRAPTLDDLYWRPGGNSDLKSETGFGWEAGMGFRSSTKRFDFSLSATYFHSNIDNWIIWLPAGNIWTPQNKRAVSSKGTETKLNASAQFGKVSMQLQGAHTWVRSEVTEGASETDASVGKQLIYVPEHQVKAHFVVRFGDLFLLFGHEFTGMRYTTSDNSASLPSYQLSWTSAGYDLRIMKKHTIGISATIENVFNTSYQTIAWRPMPGRSFRINLNYQFL